MRAALAPVTTVAARHMDLLAWLLLLALGLAIYEPALGILPLRGDNLYVLAWVDQASASDLLTLDPDIYPEWRPAAYATIWLEHAVLQLRAVELHHFVNLVLWVWCVWLVYRLIVELTASPGWALIAAGLLLVDGRSSEALMWIVERQSTLAAGLGLLASLIVVRAPARLSPTSFTAVLALLLGSALGKEYGLAFALALVAGGALSRRRDLVAVGGLATLLYCALRLSLVGGASGRYCEDMGYFLTTRYFCFEDASVAAALQAAYNVFANGAGIALPGLMSYEGRLEPQPARLVMDVLLLAVALRGVWLGDWRLRWLAAVPVGNACLGFLLYRDRNQLIGICAMAVAIGVGLATSNRRASAPWYPRLQVAIAVLLIALTARQGLGTRGRVGDTAGIMLSQDPCESDLRQRQYGDRFARRVKATFGLTNPECDATPSAY